MVKVTYLHASYAHYIAYQHLREALTKIVDVKFYSMPDVLYENDPPLWDARDIVKEFSPDVIVIGVNNTSHRSISNLDKVDCLKIMFSDDPHNWLARKAEFMNKAKIDVMLMMNYGRYYGSPNDYPTWWLKPWDLASERPVEVYGGRIPIADKYQRQLKYKCKFVHFPECVNTKFFYDRGYERVCDVFNSGSHSSEIYPLRRKIYTVLSQQQDIKSCIKPSFAFDKWGDYAKAIADSKILITGLGLFRYTSQRFVQAMASKTLLMAPIPFDSIDAHFIPGYNFVEINEENFLDKVRYYLKNKDERIHIVENAYQTILKYHTCEIRARQLIDIIRREIDGS